MFSMGYFMVHMHIAQELLRRCAAIADEAAFYRGSLAPDAPMFCPGGARADKADAHFCVGDEGWGMHTNDDVWRDNALLRVRAMRGRVNADFLFGYFAHVFADILNNERFWTPVRLSEAERPGRIDAYARDCGEIDSRLLWELIERERVLALLEQPSALELPGLARAEDIDELIRVMIHQMYKDRVPQEGYAFQIHPPERLHAYIQDACDSIMDVADAARLL
jgi:hypothetical protein